MDFITNNKIDPFAIYVFEFSHKFERQELMDIWQNVMPRQATEAEKENSIIDHSISDENASFDFFGRLDQVYPGDYSMKAQKFKNVVTNQSFNLNQDIPWNPAGIKPSEVVTHGKAYNKQSVAKIFEKELKWLVFKVKKRANNSYELLRDINNYSAMDTEVSIEKRISYNWPHDFYSLAELNKITAEITMGPEEE